MHADIFTFNGQTKIPPRYKTIIFVQRINDGIMRYINDPRAAALPPASHSVGQRRPVASFQMRRARAMQRSPPSPSPAPVKNSQPPTSSERRIFLLNTEQATVERYIRGVIQDVNRYKVPVIDYSSENISLLKKRLPNTQFIHFPFPPKPNASIPKSINLVSLQSSPHRRDSIKTVGLPTTNFSGRWGATRDALIKKHKILINIHYCPKNYNIFESIRCYNALGSRVIVVSEPTRVPEEILLKDYVIFCPVSEMRAKIDDILANYDDYYAKFFSDERVEEMHARIRQTYEENMLLFNSVRD
jgi:hypothetical protein